MIVSLAVLLVITASINAGPLQDVDQEWNQFLLDFKPNYKDTFEREYRKKIFKSNLENIKKHNAEYDLGLQTYRQGVNQFTDKTEFELTRKNLAFMNFMKRYNAKRLQDKLDLLESTAKIPDAIDWRTLGGVTPVKDQGKCLSCYAFSITGSIEGQYFRATNKTISFSEQQILDCSEKHDDGCNKGGLRSNVFEDLEKMEGIATEDDYPYKMKVEECQFNKSMAAAKITGYKLLKTGDEEALKKAVALYGPISVGIQATVVFFSFTTGIFYGEYCESSPYYMNHAVLVVGYGSENGTDIWIVKNSWGTKWGDKGYIKMVRNRKNKCNIASYALYPTLSLE